MNDKEINKQRAELITKLFEEIENFKTKMGQQAKILKLIDEINELKNEDKIKVDKKDEKPVKKEVEKITLINLTGKNIPYLNFPSDKNKIVSVERYHSKTETPINIDNGGYIHVTDVFPLIVNLPEPKEGYGYLVDSDVFEVVASQGGRDDVYKYELGIWDREINYFRTRKISKNK